MQMLSISNQSKYNKHTFIAQYTCTLLICYPTVAVYSLQRNPPPPPPTHPHTFLIGPRQGNIKCSWVAAGNHEYS